MALFNITIEKVIVKHSDEMLKEIIEKLDLLLGDRDDEELKQQIMDKLNALGDDIKSTIS